LAREYPRFSREEETELVARKNDGDGNAREQLILSCVPRAIQIAKNVAKSATGQKYDIQDLISVGMVAICEAADRFEPATARFSTYASQAILCNIIRHCRRHGQVIVEPHSPGKNERCQAALRRVRSGVKSIHGITGQVKSLASM
jgi:RNA polymerase sigma factor (sigma-70 family)